MSESGSRGRSRGRGTFKNKGDRKQRDEEENGQQVKQRRVLSDEQKADFIAYQQELDERNDRNERLVKLSRDIIIESKRIIFQLHRITTCKTDNEKKNLLDEAENRLNGIRDQQISKIADELDGLEQCQYHRAFVWGLHEFLEAQSFHKYLTKGELLTIDDARENFTFGPSSQESEKKSVELKNTDYLLGIADLPGELMRFATNLVDEFTLFSSAVVAGLILVFLSDCRSLAESSLVACSQISSGDYESPQRVASFLQDLYQCFVFIGYRVTEPDWPKKLTLCRESLQKVERIIYLMNLRKSDVPEHMLGETMTLLLD